MFLTRNFESITEGVRRWLDFQALLYSNSSDDESKLRLEQPSKLWLTCVRMYLIRFELFSYDIFVLYVQIPSVTKWQASATPLRVKTVVFVK